MHQFYVSIIFIGIMIISISFVWIFVDRRNLRRQEQLMDEKHEKVIQAIGDAEEIVEEINKFSDYVAEKFEEDGKKLENLLIKVEEKIELYDMKLNIVSTNSVKNKQNPSSTSGINMESIEEDSFGGSKKADEGERVASKQEIENRGKVIPLHQRYSEVLALANQGYTATDIAKTLHMGQGEVQLILGLGISSISSKTG